MARKKLSDAQKQFIAGGANQQVDTSANASVDKIADDIRKNLKQELFGTKTKEASIRFTVDIPASLNKRLSQLSVDTGKPKTELVRTILSQALDAIDY